ncbi:hypothetical protein CK203_106428 [Vitis vinifera]|uniref:Uncharacterized protein n=1 Tax=Vitis vinifera TaxID=29760 RepID=A0A438DGR9_VITVI|nr:hypothetical protein CK203_106428 [Vitis vinifera]
METSSAEEAIWEPTGTLREMFLSLDLEDKESLVGGVPLHWLFGNVVHNFTQMVDSIATSLSTKTNNVGIILEIEVIDMVVGNTGGHFHKHHHGPKIGIEGTQLLPLLPW